jgi:hypothetical protein
MLADDDDEGDGARRAPTCRDGCAAAMGCGMRRHERRVASLVAAKAKLGSARQLVVRAWVFSLAMSVHGFFDGLGVGVAATSAGFTSILVAVVRCRARALVGSRRRCHDDLRRTSLQLQ